MLEEMAATEGIVLGTPPVIANSHLALELAEFAKESGAGNQIHRPLFAAYFTEGRNIGELNVLLDIAGCVGLDVEAARDTLTSGRLAGQVDEEVAWAHASGITSTPTFIFDERYAVVGAQEYTAFERVMERLGHPKLAAGADNPEQPL